MITMFDSIQIDQIPPDATAVAGYTGGHWPTFTSLKAHFPRALLLSIAVTASDDADCLDVEPGDAAPAQAAAWVQRQMALGRARPCLYASVSAMGAVLAALTAASVNLDECRFWSAHYTDKAHICGPHSCGEISRQMDGTQWTNRALGRNLDESLLDDSFFSWYDTLVTEIPVVQQGSTGQIVKNWQSLVNAHLPAGSTTLKVDGVFGPATKLFTQTYQSAHKLTPDGVVGQYTWTSALTS